MSSFFKNILRLLSPSEKKEMAWLLVGMFFLGIVEFIGVGSILPFMQIVSDKASIQENPLLAYLYSFGGFSDDRTFLICIGVAVLALIIINNVYTAIIHYRIFHFAWMRNASISSRLFSCYLEREYEFYLTANTSDLEKNLFDEVRMVVVGMLNPILMMTKNLITITAVFILLMYIEPILAISTSVFLGGAYIGLFFFVSKYLKKIGAIRAWANQGRFKTADEALKGIKELNVLNRKNYFLDNFRDFSEQMSLSQARKNVVSNLPKHAFEIIAFGGILLIIIYFLALDYQLSRLIPVLSLYAFAGYRLMPALQVIFTGVSEVRYTKPALDNLLRDLEDKKYQMADLKGRKDHNDSSGVPDDSVKEIVADGIWYTYPNQNEPVLRGINFSIKAKSTVGIIGSTGSGKTTLVDILLGLLPPSKGCFRINGVQLAGDNERTWKSRVGYVPQEIFLLDDNVTNNVAYGIKAEEIDNAAVEQACKLAEIHQTIENDLDHGYKTIVGERGVKLSGGQRQRLGIARALYHDPEVLVFDEGTSALDNVTEKKLMDQVRRLSGKKTIIMIAHRLTTLQSCDIIYCLENGIIVDQGTYIEVSGRNKFFLEADHQHK